MSHDLIEQFRFVRHCTRTSTGLLISSVAACISFCLYHEGMHFAAIKSIYQQLQS